MKNDKKESVGCGNCNIICTMGTISSDEDGKTFFNQNECVEYSTCYRVLRNEGT
jgi:coenzyme F420-reducing hydrogenase beta subunit